MVEEDKINNPEILKALDLLGNYAVKIIKTFGNMRVNNFIKLKYPKNNDVFLKLINDLYLPDEYNSVVASDERFNLGFPTYNHIGYKDIFQIKWCDNVLDMNAVYAKRENFKTIFGLYTNKYSISIHDRTITMTTTDDGTISEDDVLKELKENIRLFKKSAKFYHQLKLMMNEEATKEDVRKFVEEYKNHPELLILLIAFAPESIKTLFVNEIRKNNDNYNADDISERIHFIFNRIKNGHGFTELYIETQMLVVLKSLAPGELLYEHLNKFFLNNTLQNELEHKMLDKIIRVKI